MRLLKVFPLFAIIACASGGSSLDSGGQSVAVVGGAGGLRISGSEGAKVATINFPLAEVWQVLPEVYDSLGIALTDHEEAQHALGNSGMKAYKQLAGTPMSKYIDCGNTQAFASADSYGITMSVWTQAEAKGGQTVLSTLLVAVGRPMAFAGENVKCSTKGEIEKRIADGVRAKLRR